ncbi:hypothetical protein QX776_16565 [Alteromonadaceae bacterium BrNp21-10]|nr:hypothetical protein [Alteromonadaceae bacterium BrNp21-10]
MNEQGKLPIHNHSLAANDAGLVTQVENPLSHWHANLLTLQRRNCVLLVHDQTRFPLLITCLLKKDFANLNNLFEDAFLNTLLKMGASQVQLSAAAGHIDNLVVDNQCNRSVQGTMNQMAQSVEHLLWYDNVSITDISPYRTAIWLAQRPCDVKGQKECIWPEKAMLVLLSDLAKIKRFDS